MTILSKPLRRQLETAIKQAREIAEGAAHEAIARMGVAEAEAPAHLSDDNKALRRRLRAHARTLGDTRDTAGAMSTTRLQDATSYEIWHRMLFGRFLAERGLLIHPELGAAMSVAELRDLAKEEGAADEWALAERYAAPGLPGVFKPDDPVLALPIAPEFSKRLRAALSGLPDQVFTADDSLGWTYQFWRASEKDAVNAAGGKIGAAELPAVTQLFTESYMVKFLLHNTLGAWWSGKVLALNPDLASNAPSEDALREACSIRNETWEFLRFVRENDGSGAWRPATGTFPSWPTRAAEITYCDPCCGSGHFLVEAFGILVALRQHEEGLSAADAAVLVLRDNLHGLELDGRCVQIAAFNVALAAWKLAGQPISLPTPHIAWVGASPSTSRVEMAALADGDASLRRALERLHEQFTQASVLGSLLQIGAQDLLDADLRSRGATALERLRSAGPERAEGAITARGLFDASEILAKRYVLLSTNVPFLGRARQSGGLADYILANMPEAKADLATAMLQRMLAMTCDGGTVASVTPQSWLFLGSYRAMREKILSRQTLTSVTWLGPRAFETISGEVVNTSLSIICNNRPTAGNTFLGMDVSAGSDVPAKVSTLKSGCYRQLAQSEPRSRANSVILFDAPTTGATLGIYAHCLQGLTTGDDGRFKRQWWEINRIGNRWLFLQGPSQSKGIFSGREHVVDAEFVQSGGLGGALRGREAWGKRGVAIDRMSSLSAAMYEGGLFHSLIPVMVARDSENSTAIAAFLLSEEFPDIARSVNPSLSIDNGYFSTFPFDLAQWKSVAAKKYPDGLPEPYSDDPTQWLFHGHPAYALEGTQLHVALARIAGYRWPAESLSDMRLSVLARERIALSGVLPCATSQGILTLHANSIDLSLADQLRTHLAAAYGAPLSLNQEQGLVRAADSLLDRKEARDVTLEGWVSDRAFRQHCVLFHQRPFLFHIWDGMRGGFSAFLHYQQLDRATLDKLTYTLLGDWIRTAKAEGNTARLERAEQLQQKLAKIIEGEMPFDVFVRWKPLARQPIGWEPDFDDGVRLNGRPFMIAGILRDQPKGLAWNKDRGTDASSAPWYDLGPQYGGKPGDRINDHHTSLAEKRAARGKS